MVSTKNLVTPLSLKNLWDAEYYKAILTAVASSCQFGMIREYQHDGSTKDVRANLNAIVVGEFGTGKSTMLAIDNAPQIRANTISVPALAGTTTRDGQHIIGTAFKAHGKLLIMDDVGYGENSFIDGQVKKCMNALMEPPFEFSRMLGFKMTAPVRERKSGAWVKGSENNFTIHSKFSTIVATTKLKIHTDDDRAWMSRFIPIRLHATIDYAFEFLSGSNPFKIIALNRKIPLFEFPDYLEFLEFYEEHFRGSLWEKAIISKEDEVGNIMRNVGDIVRLAAFECALEDRTRIEYEDAKKVFERFYNQIWFNIMTGPLTHEEYRVILLLDKKLTEEEIGLAIGRTQSYVSKIIDKFKAKGILVDRDVAKDVRDLKAVTWEKVPEKPIDALVDNNGNREIIEPDITDDN